MGLDMHLNGEKYFWTNWQEPEKNIMEDGFRVKEKQLDLGYWRKHPNLHGYIVATFADGKDECQSIYLPEEAMLNIIDAIKGKRLIPTKGFFFGESDGSEDEESIAIFEKAIEWLKARCGGESRTVYYKASW